MKRTHLIGTMATAVLWGLLAVPIAYGVGTGGTGLRAAYVHAAIAPVPGVVVNGVNFDPSQATITINGQDQRTPDELRPGMVAGIDGFLNPGLQDGVASIIRVRRAALGRVLQVGSGGTGIRVAGIQVVPRADAVFDGCTLADIGYRTTIDVHGYTDGISGSVSATRIECTGASDTTELYGVASAVTFTTMVVQGVTVDLTNAQFVGFSAPTAGDLVSVVGVMIGQDIFATTVTKNADDSSSSNGEDAEVEDAIGAMISPSVFVVDQFEIDATHATFSGGTATDLVRGRVVHVNGTVVNGILIAQSVEFDDSESGGSGAGSGSEDDGTDKVTGSGSGSGSGSGTGTGSGSGGGGTTYTGSVSGTISTFTSTASFVVNGMTIDASTATIVNGAATDLSVGAYVYVVGPCNGKSMKAAKIRIGGGDGTGGSDDESGDDEHEGYGDDDEHEGSHTPSSGTYHRGD